MALNVTDHYLSDEIDRLLIAGARDSLWRHVKPGRILNVGLGYGVWDEALANLQSEVVGVDIDERLVSHFRGIFPGIQYVHTDIFDYKPTGAFDTIVASHLLEHVDRPVDLLRLFRSWLAPDGRILILVPNAESIHRRIGKRMGFLRELTDLNDNDRLLGHVRVYTFDLLREHIEESGLGVREFCGLTVKAMSNAQLAGFPREYVQACVELGEDLGRAAAQIAAVVAHSVDSRE